MSFMGMPINGRLASAGIEPSPMVSNASRVAERSRNIAWCIFLIYYMSFSDFVLKFLPAKFAIPLRYFPEILIYILAISLLAKRFRVVSFPLFVPLVLCLLTMTISGILNSSSMLGVLGDFRSFFRFSVFSYVAWRTVVTPRRIRQFVNGFLGLTIAQLVVGGIELIGGPRARIFFLPAFGWETGTPMTINPWAGTGMWLMAPGSWLSGTLSNYNDYGMFMTISFSLALSMYLAKKTPMYIWIAGASALGLVLSESRHALLMLLVAGLILLVFHRNDFKSIVLLRWSAVIAMVAGAVFILCAGNSSVVGQRLFSIFNPAVVGPEDNIRLFMTLDLPPRFLAAYPFFGQGPIPPSDDVPAGSSDLYLGPTLKAAPELPGWETAFVRDVVWVLILGTYGLFGLAGFFYVFWKVGKVARQVRSSSFSPEASAISEACLATLAALILAGFFSLEVIARDTIPVFWVLAGLVMSLHSNSKTWVDQRAQVLFPQMTT